MSASPLNARALAELDALAEPIGSLTEDQIAKQFTDIYGNELRYVAEWGKWLRWDGRVWRVDTTLSVMDLARGVCREAAEATAAIGDLTPAAAARLRARIRSAASIWAVARIASTDPRHAVTVDQLDANEWELNTPGGVLDLRTGAMNPHDPRKLHTKIAAVAPGGDCPLWDALLERVLPDPAVRDYLQRLAGYALTGSSREHVLPFGYGSGANGKGTIFHALRAVLGDYGLEIPSETLMESAHDRHLTELAVLRGARLVIGSEVDSGRRWNESRLKRLTGGDPIAARYIARDMFEFLPSHTLVIVGNHKPGLRAVDEAIRRRIHLVNFAVTIPEGERDPELPERLKAEYPGILLWALAGCLEWQERGLSPPDSIRMATAEYLTAEDSIAGWIAECCERTGTVTLKAAHASYVAWCESNASQPLGRNTFADQLEARGFPKGMDARGKSAAFNGLSLPVANHWSDGE